jgi:ABC-type dipeptide/oligopeptide/nickel transport system permease subunit
VSGGPSFLTTVWRRLRADRLAFGAALLLALLVLACFVGAPLAARALGHGPDEYFPQATNFVASGSFSTLQPVGPWTWVQTQGAGGTGTVGRTLFIFGADGPLGHDEFLRLLYGGRTTFEIAFGATALALLVGVIVGTAAGFFGGRTDLFASRMAELVAAFPLLLLVTAIGWTIGARLNNVQLGMFPRGVVSLIVILGAFTWPYPARIVRSQVVELREREFIDAATVMGSGQWLTIRFRCRRRDHGRHVRRDRLRPSRDRQPGAHCARGAQRARLRPADDDRNRHRRRCHGCAPQPPRRPRSDEARPAHQAGLSGIRSRWRSIVRILT